MRSVTGCTLPLQQGEPQTFSGTHVSAEAAREGARALPRHWSLCVVRHNGCRAGDLLPVSASSVWKARGLIAAYAGTGLPTSTNPTLWDMERQPFQQLQRMIGQLRCKHRCTQAAHHARCTGACWEDAEARCERTIPKQYVPAWYSVVSLLQGACIL